MNDLVVHQQHGGALTAADMKQQVQRIQEIMEAVMKEDVHFGKIPGTDKPSLYKAGAEKLCMTFRLAPEYDIVEKERDGDHLTITSRCTLIHIPTGQKFGSALGSCSTMESKYAYRKGSRVCPECSATAIIKGKAEYGGGWLCFKKNGGCGAKFPDGDPAIEKQETGRIANEDKADQYNTVLKMSNKRALLAAVLNATAASDIFSQDLIDDDGSITQAGEDAAARAAAKPKPVRQPAAKPKKDQQQAAGPSQPGAINATQANMIRKKLEKSGKEEPGFCEHFGIQSVEELPMAKVNDALAWAEAQ
jgi:hypothetical protein